MKIMASMDPPSSSSLCDDVLRYCTDNRHRCILLVSLPLTTITDNKTTTAKGSRDVGSINVSEMDRGYRHHPLLLQRVADLVKRSSSLPFSDTTGGSTSSTMTTGHTSKSLPRILLCSHRSLVDDDLEDAAEKDRQQQTYVSHQWVFGVTKRRKQKVNKNKNNGNKDDDADTLSSSNCLGGTFDACIFWDVTLAPGTALWSAWETVRGGGIICIPLVAPSAGEKGATTTSATKVQSERLFHGLPEILLGVDGIPTCLMVDEDLQPLPTTRNIPILQQNPKPLSLPTSSTPAVASLQHVLKSFGSKSDNDAKITMSEDPLLKLCCTVDQQNVFQKVIETVEHLYNAGTDTNPSSSPSSQTNIQHVLSLGGKRGRGKSALAGLLAAGILRASRDVLLVAPSAVNVQGFLHFCLQGLSACLIPHNIHCDADGHIRQIQLLEDKRGATQTNENGTVMKDIGSTNSQKLSSLWYAPAQVACSLAKGMAVATASELPLLFVDETRSMLLPQLHELLSLPTKLVLLLGTSSGAEGTGAAVSEKLTKGLRQPKEKKQKKSKRSGTRTSQQYTLPSGIDDRSFLQLELKTPVRYALGDPVERWLESRLFLDAPPPPTNPTAYGRLADSRLCLLRPNLLSGASSPFFRQLMGLLRGHYRTSPNDLLAMVAREDTQAFVLVANGGHGPPIVAIITIAEVPETLSPTHKQGQGTHSSLSKTHLIAFNVERAFPHVALRKLSGLRPWRVITSPAVRGRGFGKRAMDLLEGYLQREPLVATSTEVTSNLPKELLDVTEGHPKRRWDFLGVSFGVTPKLYKFWSKAGFRPVELSPVVNPTTGEMSIVMLRSAAHTRLTSPTRIFDSLYPEFARKFFHQLPSYFRHLPASLCVNIIFSSRKTEERRRLWVPTELELARLSKLAASTKHINAVKDNYDLLPMVAQEYFLGVLHDSVQLTRSEEELLLALGGQRLLLEDITTDDPNSLAQMCCRIITELVYHTGTLLDMECLLTIAPRDQILLDRSRSCFASRAWLPPLSKLWTGAHVKLSLSTFDHELEAQTGTGNPGNTINNQDAELVVQEPFCSHIFNGTKTIEGRLAGGRFATLAKGSELVVRSAVTKEGLKYSVVRQSLYSSFAEMLKTEPIGKVLPGASSVKDGIAIYRQFYTEESEVAAGGVIALEIQKMPEGHAELPLSERAKIVADGEVSNDSHVFVHAQWNYSTPGSKKGHDETLVLTPDWASYRKAGVAEYSRSLCLEARLFQQLSHRAFELPCLIPQEFCIEPKTKRNTKPRWGKARVLVTVWDAVLLRVAPETFLGQVWLPELGSSISGSRVTLRLQLMKDGMSVKGIFLKVDASFEYSSEESCGKLVLDRLQLDGEAGLEVYVDVKLFQETHRAMEVPSDDGGIKLSIPARQYRRRDVLEMPVRANATKAVPNKVAKQRNIAHWAEPQTKRSKQPSFVVAANLFKLGRHLRFAGFDTAFVEKNSDARKCSKEEGRAWITTANTKQPPKGALLVTGISPGFTVVDQLRSVLGHHGILVDLSQVASRCVACNNSRLVLVSKADVAHELQGDMPDHYDEFWRCYNCSKVYWEGSVWDRAVDKIKPAYS